MTGPVKFRQSGSCAAAEGLTQEISESGFSAFVRPPGLTVGETVAVEMVLPEGPMQARALVRQRTGTHFRFQFVDLTPEQLQQIKDSTGKLDPFRNSVMLVSRQHPQS
jgi:hypothetical protein